MNLSQIIQIVAEMEKEWADTKTEWASYKDFIDNYFNNLDVSDEVLQALRTMADDGSLNVITKESLDKAQAIRQMAEKTLFKGSDLYLLDSLDVGEYAYGADVKRALIKLQLAP